MNKLTTLAVMLCVASLIAGCATAPANNGRACTGWSKGQYSKATADYIAKNDTAFARWVIAHNTYGTRIRCWK